MNPEQLRDRATEFAKGVVLFARPLLAPLETRDIATQLRRAAMSVASNYRAAGRARSHREFTSKIGLVVEEADEALHWLKFLRVCQLENSTELERLTSEASQLVAIFAKSHQTARARADRQSHDHTSPDHPTVPKRDTSR